MIPAKDMTGSVYGRLTVISRSGSIGGKAAWLCRCECGVEKVIRGDNVRFKTRSCGCLITEALVAMSSTHGGTRVDGKLTKEWSTWLRMRQRCSDKSYEGWHHYGGRGIRVCNEWEQNYASFLRDMGPRPSDGHSLDRINNDAGYDCGRCADCTSRGAPPNCRWATNHEQSRNRRNNRMFTYQGRTMCVVDWAEFLGMDLGRLQARIASGWSFDDAVSIPKRAHVRKAKKTA